MRVYPVAEKLLCHFAMLIASGFLLCVLISFTVEKKQKIKTLRR